MLNRANFSLWLTVFVSLFSCLLPGLAWGTVPPYPATATGTTTTVAGPTGFGNCLSLVHTGYLTIATPQSFAASMGVTFECRFLAISPPGLCGIMGGNGWQLQFNSNKILLVVNSLTVSIPAGTTNYNDGAWHSVAVIFDTASNANLYVDGTYFGRGSAGPGTFQLQTIGSTNASIPYSFQGDIDAVTVTQGVKYTANYTPTTATGANSAIGQMSVYNFEDTTPTTTYADTNIAIAGILAGSLGRTARGLSSMTIACNGTTGGTAPLHYQEQRAPVTGGQVQNGTMVGGTAGTFVNVGSASTGNAFADTSLTSGTTYAYQCIITDSTTPTAQTVTSASIQVSTQTIGGLYVAYFGDSVILGYLLPQAGQDPATIGQFLLQSTNLTSGALRVVEIVNAGVVGSTTTSWVGLIGPGMAIANGIGATIYVFDLGINDSNTANNLLSATYKANYLSLIATIKAQSTNTPKIFLNNPIFTNDGRDQTTVLTYPAAIASMVDNNSVFQGDIYGYGVFQKAAASAANGSVNALVDSDGIHPNVNGARVLGNLWFLPIARKLNIVPGGPGSHVIPRSGGRN